MKAGKSFSIYVPLFLSIAIIFLACGGGGGGDGTNVAPVADAGSDQSVLTDTLVTLYGNGSSDADGDTLTYMDFYLCPFGKHCNPL